MTTCQLDDVKERDCAEKLAFATRGVSVVWTKREDCNSAGVCEPSVSDETYHSTGARRTVPDKEDSSVQLLGLRDDSIRSVRRWRIENRGIRFVRRLVALATGCAEEREEPFAALEPMDEESAARVRSESFDAVVDLGRRGQAKAAGTNFSCALVLSP